MVSRHDAKQMVRDWMLKHGVYNLELASKEVYIPDIEEQPGLTIYVTVDPYDMTPKLWDELKNEASNHGFAVCREFGTITGRHRTTPRTDEEIITL